MKENVRQTLDLHRPKGAKTAANKIKKDRLQGESRQIPSHHVDEPTDTVGGRYGEGEETEKQTTSCLLLFMHRVAIITASCCLLLRWRQQNEVVSCALGRGIWLFSLIRATYPLPRILSPFLFEQSADKGGDLCVFFFFSRVFHQPGE